MMRELMRIVESAMQPAWFTQGRPLSPENEFGDDQLDVGEFLEGDEWDYEWRLCRVPVALLPKLDADDIADMDAQEPGRMDSVREWLKKGGGDVLKRRPIIVLLTENGAIEVLDGYHRITAAAELGMPDIIAAVGLGERVSNE